VEDGTTLLADAGLDWEVKLADTVTVSVRVVGSSCQSDTPARETGYKLTATVTVNIVGEMPQQLEALEYLAAPKQDEA